MKAPSVTAYRDQVRDALAAGSTFAGLYATAPGEMVRAVFEASNGDFEVFSVDSQNGDAPSIVDLIPAAGWDEREAHDLQAVTFTGHHPLRPLVDHDHPARDWTVPVHGRDAYQVAVGPVHAGVIESGHFRFHVVGDRILQLDAQLFYKHRGLESSAQGSSLHDGLLYIQRACAACSVANAAAYATACEQLLGVTADAELERARHTLVELERIWNHLNDIAAICAGVGMAAGNQAFAALTERARRMNHHLTGHRFLRGAVQVGASQLDWSAGSVHQVRQELNTLEGDARRAWRELAFNNSFQDRLVGVGIIDANTARRLGAVGPAARAAGISLDHRRHTHPGFTAVVAGDPDGDVRARYQQRALELWQSFQLLEQLLDRPLRPGRVEPGAEPTGPVAVGAVEGPRGRTVCAVECDGDRLGRVHLRTGSYANWPAVAAAAAGNLLPDFPLINKSFELCYACTDR
jgi:Ni,Fe-hydrogenase III large subunit